MKKISITFCLILLSLTSGCTSTPVEDKFIDATTEISCVQKKLLLDDLSQNPLLAEKNTKELQKRLSEIAKKYGFSRKEELDALAKIYLNDPEIIEKAKETMRRFHCE